MVKHEWQDAKEKFEKALLEYACPFPASHKFALKF
jgi:hypothetical protein